MIELSDDEIKAVAKRRAAKQRRYKVVLWSGVSVVIVVLVVALIIDRFYPDINAFLFAGILAVVYFGLAAPFLFTLSKYEKESYLKLKGEYNGN